MMEEVNLELQDLRQFHVYSDPSRDFRHHSVDVTHVAKSFAFYSQIESVRHYIRNQHERHRIKTFEEEYIALLKLHNIEFEQRYLFEAEHFG